MAEGLGVGYLQAGLMFGAIIGLIAATYYALRLDATIAFWLAYILTRPLGASFGDFFAQPPECSGLGFGTTVTSFIFIGLITLTVIYMTITHRGEEVAPAERSANEMNPAYGEDVEG